MWECIQAAADEKTFELETALNSKCDDDHPLARNAGQQLICERTCENVFFVFLATDMLRFWHWNLASGNTFECEYFVCLSNKLNRMEKVNPFLNSSFEYLWIQRKNRHKLIFPLGKGWRSGKNKSGYSFVNTKLAIIKKIVTNAQTDRATQTQRT